jgi:stage II sporulation protein AB (anti-sigma F factor)
MKDFMLLRVPAESKNEAFVRNAVALFCVELNPTIDWLEDVKTSVSEAITNSVVHAYKNRNKGEIEIYAEIENGVHIRITDYGVGIKDLEKALTPYFTTDTNEERAGIGFTVIKSFMDDMQVVNNEFGGTTVKMYKRMDQKE